MAFNAVVKRAVSATKAVPNAPAVVKASSLAAALPYASTIHLDASKGITMDANNKVSVWADQSGNGNNASQIVSANQPTFGTDSNGKGYVSVTPSTMDFANIDYRGKTIVIAYANPHSVSNASYALFSNNPSGSKFTLIGSTFTPTLNAITYYQVGVKASTVSRVVGGLPPSTPPLLPNNVLAQSLSLDASGNLGTKLFSAGLLTGYTNVNIGVTGLPQLSNIGYFTTSDYAYIYDFIVYDAILTEADYAILDTYFKSTYI